MINTIHGYFLIACSRITEIYWQRSKYSYNSQLVLTHIIYSNICYGILHRIQYFIIAWILFFFFVFPLGVLCHDDANCHFWTFSWSKMIIMTQLSMTNEQYAEEYECIQYFCCCCCYSIVSSVLTEHYFRILIREKLKRTSNISISLICGINWNGVQVCSFSLPRTVCSLCSAVLDTTIFLLFYFRFYKKSERSVDI